MSSNSIRLLKATRKAIHRLDDSELTSIDEAKTSRSPISVQTWYFLTQNFIHLCQPSLFVSFRFVCHLSHHFSEKLAITVLFTFRSVISQIVERLMAFWSDKLFRSAQMPNNLNLSFDCHSEDYSTT
jgi:hypothetical protein